MRRGTVARLGGLCLQALVSLVVLLWPLTAFLVVAQSGGSLAALGRAALLSAAPVGVVLVASLLLPTAMPGRWTRARIVWGAFLLWAVFLVGGGGLGLVAHVVFGG